MEKLDTVIFSGWDKPSDDDTGAKIIQKIMNVTGVKKDKIHFYSAQESTPAHIVRNSYIRDKSQPSGYRIDDTLFIASESLGSQRLTLKQLSKVGIEPRTGYQHVDFSDMTESELKEWMNTGKYAPTSSHGGDSDESSTESLIESLFGDIEDEKDSNADNTDSQDSHQEEVSTATPVSSMMNDDEKRDTNENNSHQESEDDDILHSMTDLLGGNDSHDSSNSGSNDSHNDNNSFAEQPSSPTDDNDDEVEEIFDAEIVEEPSTEDKLHNPEKVFDPRDREDTSQDDAGVNDILSRLHADKPNDDVMRLDDDSQESHYDTASHINLHDDYSPQQKSQSASIENDVQQYKKEHNIVDSGMNGGDSEYLDKIVENRKNAEKRKKKQQEQMEKEYKSTPESTGHLAQLQAMAGGNSKIANEINQKDEKDRRERYHTEALAEDNRREDGSRKNFREYLDDKSYKQQKIDEDIRENFGNLKNYDKDSNGILTKEEDTNYVAKGTGRIILCTAGKGGVGKTLVSIGMASALSLARAYETKSNPGYTPSRTWLIESDYNSPKLASAFNTNKKHLGNLAKLLDNKGALSNSEVRDCIEDNVYRDPDTGVNVLACPPLSMGVSSASIPMAIFYAIKYASNQGDDVIVDHGNLTVGEYSSLDKILATKTAHRVVVVGNMGCIDQTQTALDVLTSPSPGRSTRPRNAQSVSVVLNKALQAQFYTAQEALKPFKIIASIPPIDALREEYSETGNTYLNNAPSDVKKAVYDRCGIVLTHLGYHSLQKFFVAKPHYGAPRGKGKRSFVKKIVERFSRD